jgi:hypothetical protein
MIKNIFSFLSGTKREKIDQLRDEVIKARNKDIKELQSINKKIKLLVDGGHIEIVIKNVKGVIREDYGKK